MSEGVKTSENWITWSGTVLAAWFGLAEQNPGMSMPEAIVKASAFIAMAGVIIAYSLSRGKAKSK